MSDFQQQAHIASQAHGKQGGIKLALFGDYLGHALDDVMAFLGLKDRSMKQLVGGEGSEGGGSSGGGGGEGFASSGDGGSSQGIGSGAIFSSQNISNASLGDLTPSATPNMSQSSSQGWDMGV